jgi:hypothetical protein
MHFAYEGFSEVQRLLLALAEAQISAVDYFRTTLVVCGCPGCYQALLRPF